MQFGGMRAVNGMSLDLLRGEILGLIGPNGAGKTTLFNMLAGQLRPTSGQIMLNGKDVTRDPPEARIAKGMGRTFQIPRPFAQMTVLENMLTGAQGQSGEGILANFLKPGKVAWE
jgi:branched-chain amino acid transport system ATP-binding protein